MLLIEITPFSRPVAFTEIIIILLIAAAVGYFLARLVARAAITRIEEEISEKQLELDECRSRPVQPIPIAQADTPRKGAFKTVYPIEEPDPGICQDLKVIEGIGPKIEEILNKNGIQNYSQLSAIPAVRIARILQGAGPRFQMHDPTTWPEQATLAHEGKWEELNALKDKLIGGR
ncbi:hypothetical protein DSL64_23335 [Dyadobacter luteus]|uniref:DUF4332 domain-containing protein n=1 Tax=Dyadobacter luteus TaxID=2259619 RepID=A0A3D8Y5A8_9BACT|nr:hypothetical protein [Dyadobacter luteus]REA57673.1 hypothetical protein DSL64_23335 [Dyadobacter luteus]